jgi:hypothetical protein
MMLRAALAYAQRLGWPVLPLRKRGKEPLCSHGVHDATTDPAVIRAWWERWPDANVGVACAIDRTVIDIDPRNGGDDAWSDLVRHHGDVPPTPRAFTGGGGVHIPLRLPAAPRGTLGPGIDIKSAGGYIVAAPSVHPCGQPYQWEAAYHPLDVPIADAPAWLVELAGARATREVGPATGAAAQSFLARAFDVAGWLGCDLPNGAVAVRCPWWHEHTDGRGDGSDSSTVILPPTSARPLGTFRCSQGHCATRGTIAALEALPEMAIALAKHGDPAGFELACSLLLKGAA